MTAIGVVETVSIPLGVLAGDHWLRNILEIGKNAVDAAGESIAGEGGGDDPKESENTKNE